MYLLYSNGRITVRYPSGRIRTYRKPLPKALLAKFPRRTQLLVFEEIVRRMEAL